jgi:hypothetical protein
MTRKYRTDTDRIHYEAALWKMWGLDRKGAREILSKWQPSPQSPLSNMRKASLLAELGDLSEARTLLRSALSEVRRSLRIRTRNIELLSLEGWCTYLLASVEPALDLAKYAELGEEFEERWQKLRLWDCDPWVTKEFFETLLSSGPPKPPKLEERSRGFDPGTVRVSRKFAWDLLGPLLPAFACVRYFEQVGIPMSLPRVNISGDILARACQWIAPYTSFWSPAVFIRARRTDFLAQRSQADRMEPTAARRLYAWCLEVLKRELPFLAAPIPSASTEASLLRVLVEVLSNLAFKVDGKDLSETLPLVLRLHHHPGVRLNSSLANLCGQWFRRLFFAAEPTLLLEWLPALTRAPLPEQKLEQGIPIGDQPHDPMEFFPGSSLRGLNVNGEALSNVRDATDWLLMRAKSESGEGRWTAIIRLVRIYRTGFMSADQQCNIGALLWQRRNAVGLPDLDRFPLQAYLELPAPPELDPRELVKQYVLTMGTGSRVSRAEAGGIRMAVGGQEFTFIHIASAVSRPIVALKGEEFGTVEWTREGVMQLYSKARDWWANDRQAFDTNVFGWMGAVESLRETATRLGQFFSRIVLPEMKTAGEEQWKQVLGWLEELRGVAAFPTVALPYILLHRRAEFANIKKTVAEDIASDNEDAITEAARAIRHWVHLSAIEAVPAISPDLITALVERVAFRRKSGILACFVQLTFLIVERPTAISLSHANLLSAALVPWHEATFKTGEEAGFVDFDDEELPDLRACVGRLAGALRSWYANTLPDVSEPLGISQWQQWSASEALPEVRRAFSAWENLGSNPS